jgi:hypothetical protein
MYPVITIGGRPVKRFYLARYIDAEASHKTYLREVVRPVTSQGWTKDGLRIEKWALVFARDIAEARAKFDRGDCSWES